MKKNVYVTEFNTLFEFLSNTLDYAVMKYVGDNIKILSKQEEKHAVLHLQAKKQRKNEGETASRYNWFFWLADYLLLRCGPQLGIPLCLHIESAAWAWFYYPLMLPFVSKNLTNLFVFHGMEEIEHGALTVQLLRSKTSLLVSFLTFPIVLIVHIVLLLSPPIVLLIQHPYFIFNLKNNIDFVKYYLAFIPAFIISTYGQILHCLLPIQENDTIYNNMSEFYKQELKNRGIEFKICNQENYILH